MKRRYAPNNLSSLDMDYSGYIGGQSITNILAIITPRVYLNRPLMLWLSLLFNFGKKNEGKRKKGGGGIPVDLIIVLSSLQRYARLETRESISIIALGSSEGKDVRTSVWCFHLWSSP